LTNANKQKINHMQFKYKRNNKEKFDYYFIIQLLKHNRRNPELIFR